SRGSLEDLARLAAPEEQVERRHRNPNLLREVLDSSLDVQVSLRSQGPREPTQDAVTDQIPEDMSVQDGEVLAAARVPQEMAGLFQPSTVDFADEPTASVLRGRERIQRLGEFPVALRKESLPRPDDEGGFVIVESGPMTQECRNLVGPTGP